MITLYADRKISSFSRLIVSPANPIAASAPSLVLGDQLDIRVVLYDRAASAYDSASGDAAITPKVAVGRIAPPTSGQFTLNYNSNAIPVTVTTTAAQLQASIEALPGIGSGNVSVIGSAGKYYEIEFIGSLANTDIGLSFTSSNVTFSPRANVTIDEVQTGGGGSNERWTIRIRPLPLAIATGLTTFDETGGGGDIGWEGTFALTQPELYFEMLDGGVVETLTLEIELTGSIGPETVVSQPVQVKADVIEAAFGAQPQIPTTLTATELEQYFLRQRSDLTALTGGGSTALDGVDTADLEIGTTYQITIAGVRYVYQLTDSTQAESSPKYIRPDDYATTTNERVWVLLDTGVINDDGNLEANIEIADATTITLPIGVLGRIGTSLRIGDGTTSEGLRVAGLEKVGTAWIGGDQTGNARGANALDIQTNRDSVTHVASGDQSIALGNSSRAFGYGAIAAGSYAEANEEASAFGFISRALGVESSAFGYNNTASGDRSGSFGHFNNASGEGSHLFGHQLITTVDYTVEMGYWPILGTRGSSVRCHPNGQIALTYVDSATAPTDGGATAGSEADGTLPRNTITFQVNGSSLIAYKNTGGTITSFTVGTFS